MLVLHHSTRGETLARDRRTGRSSDSYGSITSITTNGVTRNTPTTYSTNRLSSGVYDARGNLTSYNGTTYVYDRLNRMIRTNHPGVSLPEDWLFAYTADDERIVAFCLNGESINQFRWMLRNLDGKVIREFRGGSSTTDVYYDYAYRGDQLLAAEIRNAGGGYDTRHYTLDHLGKPRLVTDDAKNRLAEYEYYPYGDSATTASPIGYLRFTGHERDTLAEGGSSPNADDLDYLHARFFNPVPGRFQSFDPVGGNPRAPQSWNRFAYVLGNPLKYVDPTGLKECEVPNCTVDGEAPPIGLPPTYLNTEFEKFKAEFRAFRAASDRGGLVVSPLGGAGPSLFVSQRSLSLSSQGLMAYVDGLNPLGSPLESWGLYDPQEAGMTSMRHLGLGVGLAASAGATMEVRGGSIAGNWITNNVFRWGSSRAYGLHFHLGPGNAMIHHLPRQFGTWRHHAWALTTRAFNSARERVLSWIK